ncbi:unnamed protein product [Rotaria sp. Silwood2]|nr:unnamed protein product [Rotaria sp. Silwood2]CAF2972170.1 unnamed protein product [Rotaria sp. Silwood2]CAF4082757.1 unnamed protein product [Rotaria sp. Silwood2]CAF4222909.1 unnamed protein product [Rotaria sp. Silwood2]
MSHLFSSDEDDNNEKNDQNRNDSGDLMETTQYSTPTAQEQRTQETSTVRLPAITMELPGLKESLTPRGPSVKRQRRTTTTIARQIEIIDVVAPNRTPIGLYQPNYIPRTLHFYNQYRLSILPTFPSRDNNDSDNPSNLLLANVSPIQLSRTELGRRQTGEYKCIFTMTDPSPPTSSMMYNYYKNYFLKIVDRFHIDISILDHNYARLQQVLQLFRTRRAQILHANKRMEDTFYLHDHELPQLLEFYLQMDVDLFYMKTCSFRKAQPRSDTEGIFCATTPECRYKMTACGQCKICQTPIDLTYRQPTSILFNRAETHRFVNGYESILNCPVTCNTRNIIYALTCLCGQYDYISETSYTLAKRLEDHYQIANLAIGKLLLGEKNTKRLPIYKDNSFTSNKQNMLLYQHPKQCSATVQAFLDGNPQFWPLVPMKNEDADADNVRYERMRLTTTTISNIYQDENIQKYLKDLPNPPEGYRFSKRQVEKQIHFFRKNFHSTKLYDEVPLYNATIIAALPHNTSGLFRQIIHSLFVTHTEAKLNTLGHIFDMNMDINIRQGAWCANLVRRSV